MKNKFICIHGHFYQPPRENPWTSEVGIEESAAPHPNWNERILLECYDPNTSTPLLDAQGHITERIDVYEHISFNFGPTLLSWIERTHPETYQKILDSDRKSFARRAGHGNAIAQAYNHVIMPLASRRDKVTQIRWGKADFYHRFGRAPEGMWLPETAVDEETLEVLAQEDIRFTILSPHQAAQVRTLHATEAAWKETTENKLDTTQPYRWVSQEDPSRFIDLFFFHRPISNAISFERLLDSGDNLLRHIGHIFSHNDIVQLGHMATDGEVYGHHHRFGNMALAYAIQHMERYTHAFLTNYGEFLSQYPPLHEVKIHSNTSWSCAHGVERWRDNCGCKTGAHTQWSQQWRKPLREALDVLSLELDRLYVEEAEHFFKDPWECRNHYIECILDPNPHHIHSFINKHSVKHLSPKEAEQALRLCEMEHHRMLMFTSCGWFFDEISGIEPVQILKYAARAIELSGPIERMEALEKQFFERLSRCLSNVPEFKNGMDVYQKLVMPLRQEGKLVQARSSSSGQRKGERPCAS